MILSHCSSVWGGHKCHCVVITDSGGFDETLRNKLTEMEETFSFLLKYSQVSFEFCCLNQRPTISDNSNDQLFAEFLSKNAGGGEIYYLDSFSVSKVGKNLLVFDVSLKKFP